MMKKKLHFRKRLYCSVVAILSLFVVCNSNLQATNDSQQSLQESKVGTKAPDFTITKNGESVSLADFGTRIKVLNFSSTSAESRKMNTEITKLEEQYKGADVVFINISLDEYADVAKQYGVSGPTVCVVGPSGVINGFFDSGNVDLTQELKTNFGY